MQKYFPNNGLVLLKSWINGHFLNRDDGATREYVNEQDVANLISRRQEAWANASCNANTGDFTPYARDRIRTSSHEYGVPLTPGVEYVVSRYANPSTYAYEMVIYFYEENNAYIGGSKSYTVWIQEFPFRFIAPDNVHHCIIGIRHSDNSEISISEAVDHTLFRMCSPAIEDLTTKEYVSRRATVTYDYGGRNLKDVFGTPEALHAALAAEDYSRIAVGDYWPITLNGKYYDYGTYTIKTGVNYYSNDNLQTQVGVTTGQYQGEYVSEIAVSFSLSGSTYYVSVADCLPYYERNFNSVAVKMEIAGINHYWKYGDGNNGGLLANGTPHLSLISRDSLPIWLRMRKGLDVWEDTSSNNPWLGSAMYKTLNDPEHGILNLLMQTELSKYIYTGPNEKGMRAMLESKAPGSKNTTSYTDWRDRGILFLPTPTEVWGFPFQVDADSDRGLANQFALFRDSRRHILKGGGDGAGRADWWLSTSAEGYSSEFSRVSNTGCPAEFRANYPMPIPLCFIFM